MKLSSEFLIDGKTVGLNTPPYIIAEMSANHCGDEVKAKEIISAAKECGVDAIKLQTYKAETLTLNHKSDFFYIDQGPWAGQYMYDLYQQGELDWDIQARLFEYAREIGLTIFSSPFDATSVDFLESVDCVAYKIASPEIIDLPLIKKVARTGKPMIISTGNATVSDIHIAVETALQQGCSDIALLKCTSTYPAPPSSINLKTIEHMKEMFHTPVGLSDHTMGIAVPLGSIALGATIIEKHFILDRNDESIDNFFSATPDEMKALVDGAKDVYAAIGHVSYPTISPQAKKSIIVVEDISVGECFNEHNIKVLRPGGGLEPKYYDQIIGRTAVKDLKRGDVITMEDIGSYKI
ncbi:MAG: pseudaminic acid synthase [Hydrogenimonas sp.]|nr:MAG: pseudaminic acid synthase [Hydrogenimonas sp.]